MEAEHKAKAVHLQMLKEGTVGADGTEEIMVEQVKIGKTMGYIDLSNLSDGDEVTIRQYIKLKTNGEYREYAEETYSGVQLLPVIYLTLKESNYGIKTTLQQTTGINRSFDYYFLKED